jgi:hypothetical protein
MPRSLVFLLACACSCGAQPAETTTPRPEPGPENEPTVEPTPAASATAAPYSVHEWGLIDVLEDGTTELAAGPGAPPRSMSVRKPVLYFHLAPGTSPLTIDVRARIVGGSILEAFPADLRPSPDVAAWSATLEAGHCATVPVVVDPAARESRRWARRVERPCYAPDGICEVWELPRYDAASADCVTVSGTRAGMLFYRGSARPSLPIRAERLADGTLRVTATGSLVGAPGDVMRISTAMTGPWPMGHVVVSHAALPAEGASVSLPLGTSAVDRGSERLALQSGLSLLGLDEGESRAFLDAWMDGLFGPEPGVASTAPPIPQDAIVFFLPEAAVSGIAELTLTPPPTELRRAFIVRIMLPAVDTA